MARWKDRGVALEGCVGAHEIAPPCGRRAGDRSGLAAGVRSEPAVGPVLLEQTKALAANASIAKLRAIRIDGVAIESRGRMMPSFLQAGARASLSHRRPRSGCLADDTAQCASTVQLASLFWSRAGTVGVTPHRRPSSDDIGGLPSKGRRQLHDSGRAYPASSRLVGARRRQRLASAVQSILVPNCFSLNTWSAPAVCSAITWTSSVRPLVEPRSIPRGASGFPRGDETRAPVAEAVTIGRQW